MNEAELGISEERLLTINRPVACRLIERTFLQGLAENSFDVLEASVAPPSEVIAAARSAHIWSVQIFDEFGCRHSTGGEGFCQEKESEHVEAEPGPEDLYHATVGNAVCAAAPTKRVATY